MADMFGGVQNVSHDEYEQSRATWNLVTAMTFDIASWLFFCFADGVVK